MTVFLRILWRLLTTRFRRRIAITDRAITPLRVWPHEAGISYMHHHGYLQMMEVGRWDLMLRAGKVGETLRGGYLPVVASQMVRYRRPIRRFARFEVHTQIVHWDDKDAFVEQSLHCDGTAMALSVSRYRFPGGKRTKSPVEVMREVWQMESPPAPAWVASWMATEELVAPHQPSPS